MRYFIFHVYALCFIALAGCNVPPSPVQTTSNPLVIDQQAYRSSVRGMGPKVAFDGTNYFVVWAKQTTLNETTYNHELRGMRISPSGSVLDAGGFVIASKQTKYNSFNLASDGTQFLVVWEEDVAHGPAPVDYNTQAAYVIECARVSFSGSVLDTTPITIDAVPFGGENYTGYFAPDVFWAGFSFVVVYREGDKTLSDETRIAAKMVSSAGTVASAKTTLINDPQIGWFGQQRVVWNQGEGLLGLLGYNTTTSNYGIYSIALSINGGQPAAATLQTVVSGPREPSGGIPFAWPAVCSSSNGNYLMVFEDERNKQISHPNLRRARIQSIINQPGGSVTDKGLLVADDSDRFPAMAFDGKSCAVVYSHKSGCHSYIGAVRLDAQGDAGPETFFNFSTLNNYDLVYELDLAFSSTNGLVVFEDFNPPSTTNGPDFSTGIFGVFINK